MLVQQLSKEFESSLLKKGVTLIIRKEKEFLVPMEFVPMLYDEITSLEQTAKRRGIKASKSSEMIEGKEYQVIELGLEA